LQEAVAAFRAALQEQTPERVPLDWAGTQNNLGIALQTLGERESGTQYLEEAVGAFQKSLKVFQAADATHDVETTTNNLVSLRLHWRRRKPHPDVPASVV
jgi:tetratricopeptide (TPR) repeat protein